MNSRSTESTSAPSFHNAYQITSFGYGFSNQVALLECTASGSQIPYNLPTLQSAEFLNSRSTEYASLNIVRSFSRSTSSRAVMNGHVWICFEWESLSRRLWDLCTKPTTEVVCSFHSTLLLAVALCSGILLISERKSLPSLAAAIPGSSLAMHLTLVSTVPKAERRRRRESPNSGRTPPSVLCTLPRERVLRYRDLLCYKTSNLWANFNINL